MTLCDFVTDHDSCLHMLQQYSTVNILCSIVVWCHNLLYHCEAQIKFRYGCKRP